MNGSSEDLKIEMNKWGIHFPLNDTQLYSATMANACPYMNLYWMLRFGLKAWLAVFWSISNRESLALSGKKILRLNA